MVTALCVGFIRICSVSVSKKHGALVLAHMQLTTHFLGS